MESPQGPKKMFEKIAINYKFYLAFENSNCHDYVTEKYYKTLNHNIGMNILVHAQMLPLDNYTVNVKL